MIIQKIGVDLYMRSDLAVINKLRPSHATTCRISARQHIAERPIGDFQHMPLYQALAQEAIEAVRQDTAFDVQLLHELLLGEGHIG